jgi:hypothetical protein
LRNKYRKFGRHADIIELVDFPSQENSTNSAVCLSFLLLIRILDEDEIELHNRVIVMRDTAYAHSDARSS